MSKYQTIQKLAEDTGIDPSSVRNLIKRGILTKHYLEGFARPFVDVEEFNSKMVKDANNDIDNNLDLDHFLVS